MLGYKPSPTGHEFITSRAFLKYIMGPVGGGKSTVCLMDLLARAIHQEPFKNVRRTKFIILRNTIAQLKSTVKPLIDTWFVTLTNGTMGSWRLSENTFEARFQLPDGTVVHSEFLMMAADTPEDVRRLLSLECSAAWVEEAREVDEEVFAGLQGRVNRFPSRIAGGVTYPGVICSTNPPPIDGFWHKFATEEDKGKAVFLQPPALLESGELNPEAENLENLAPEYYDNLIAGKTEDWINVYLKNMFGAGNMGQPLYKGTFKKSFHVSDKPLNAVMQTINPLMVGMDNGLQAAAVVGQVDMRGRLNILNESYVPKDSTMGVETFLSTLLVPLLRKEYPGFRPENILFIVDPACFQRSQVDEKTIAQAVQAYGFRVQKAPTNDPERRIQSVEGLLSQQIDGGAALLIDPRCSHTANALEWGHRYKRGVGGVMTTQAEKNHHSHCFVAGTMVLTTDGLVPIERVTCDTRVVTPQGAQPVLATMSHWAPELMVLRFDNGTTLRCTPDHPFFTERGVVLAEEIQYTDVLFSSGEYTCPDKNTPSKSLRGSGTIESLTGTTSRTASSMVGDTCTALFGSFTTGLSRLTAMCTTLTGTSQTTGQRILSASQRQNMYVGTCSTGTVPQKDYRRAVTRWTRAAMQQLLGTPAPRGSNGTLRTAEPLGSTVSGSSAHAHTAGRHIQGWSALVKRASAQPPVRPGLERSRASTTKPEYAQNAVESSEPIGTPKQKRAVRLVERQRFQGQNEKVYDLTVAEEHCFYAGDILVHNCGDAVQYLCSQAGRASGGWGSGAPTRLRTVVPSTYYYA